MILQTCIYKFSNFKNVCANTCQWKRLLTKFSNYTFWLLIDRQKMICHEVFSTFLYNVLSFLFFVCVTQDLYWKYTLNVWKYSKISTSTKHDFLNVLTRSVRSSSARLEKFVKGLTHTFDWAKSKWDHFEILKQKTRMRIKFFYDGIIFVNSDMFFVIMWMNMFQCFKINLCLNI